MVARNQKQQPQADGETARRFSYIMEYPLSDLRAELARVRSHDRRSATMSVILLLLLDLNDRDRTKIIAMLSDLYFKGCAE